MPQPPRPMPSHKNRTIKLLAISHRLQQIMINEDISPDELVACANSVKSGYDAVSKTRDEFIPPPKQR